VKSGRLTRKHEPLPGCELAVAVPSCASAIAATIARPGPTPPLSREREESVGVTEQVACGLARGATQDRVDAGDELGEAERLRDACAEGFDLVPGRVRRGQEEDGGPEPLRAQPAPDFDPLEAGEEAFRRPSGPLPGSAHVPGRQFRTESDEFTKILLRAGRHARREA
jgi:hypothetical protein